MKDWPWFRSPAINLAAKKMSVKWRDEGLPLLRSLQILDSLAIFPPNEIVLVSIWYHSSPVFLVEMWVSLLESHFSLVKPLPVDENTLILSGVHISLIPVLNGLVPLIMGMSENRVYPQL